MRRLALAFGASAAFALAATPANAQAAKTAAQLAPGQTCAFVTAKNATDSAGTANVNHDGSALKDIAPPDISKGFQGIPRSAQPKLTASQKRILECSYKLAEANADMPYTLFVPTTYDAKKPTPLIVDLHGLNITPLQQMLFDGTTDLAEANGYIVVAPMGFSLAGWWGARAGAAVPTAAKKPGTEDVYKVGELSEIDAMTLIKSVRDKYNVDPNRIYLMGHSMGGGGTYYLGSKYADIWAGLAPISGAGGINTLEAAQAYKGVPILISHGEKDSIVSADTSRRASMYLQQAGAQHLYVQVPGADHEFWIRRGAENMKRIFMFFNTVSKATNVGLITPEMATPAPRAAPPPKPTAG
jgi:poly(3-hydroxybutyrate) depolymerase